MNVDNRVKARGATLRRGAVMRINIDTWNVLHEAANEWMEDKASQLGAAMAFYSVLSLAPLLVIAIAIAALVFGEQEAKDQLAEQMTELMGPAGAEAVVELIQQAQQPRVGTMAALLGLATLLFGASGVFGELQDAMNTIWEVKPQPMGVWGYIRSRFLSFAMVLGTGFLLLASLVLSAWVTGVSDLLARQMAGLDTLAQMANQLISFGVVMVLFALIFRMLPDTNVAWRDVWFGAAITALLFSIGKYLIGLYLGTSSVGSAYGAAGSLVVLVLWIYYSAQIMFFGAEITQVWARKFGSRAVGQTQAADEPLPSLLPHQRASRTG
jgi:membrane protein